MLKDLPYVLDGTQCLNDLAKSKVIQLWRDFD